MGSNPTFSSHYFIYIMETTCKAQPAIDAFWLGCRATLRLIRDLWKAESHIFEHTKSPHYEHNAVFPCLSREHLEGYAEHLRMNFDCECDLCIRQKEWEAEGIRKNEEARIRIEKEKQNGA